MAIALPAGHNRKLAQLVERVNQDRELHQLWKCANVNAVDRSGICQLDELLRGKLANSTIAPHVEVVARIEAETEKRLVQVYSG